MPVVQRLYNSDQGYDAAGTSISSSGVNTVLAVGAGERLQLCYVCLSADGANSADVTAEVRIGASVKYKVSLKAGAMWARNIGAGRFALKGPLGDDFIINLSAAQTVHVSYEAEKVTS